MRIIWLLAFAIFLLGCDQQGAQTNVGIDDAKLTPVQKPAGDGDSQGGEGETANDSADPTAAMNPMNAPGATASRLETAEPERTPRPVVEDRSSTAAAKLSGEINFDDLKFPIEKDQAFEDGMLTAGVEQLHGQKVKLRGFILPASVFQNEGIKRFVLVRDNQECCFGPGAALFDCVMVEMVGKATADFATRPVTVEGRFAIDTEKYKYPGGKGPRGASHLAIFEMAATNVE